MSEDEDDDDLPTPSRLAQWNPHELEELNALLQKLNFERKNHHQQQYPHERDELNAFLHKFNLEKHAAINLQSAIQWLNRTLDHVRGQHDDNHIQLVLNDAIERINYAADRGGWSDKIRDHFRGHPLLSQSQILGLGQRPGIGHNQGPELDDPLTPDQKLLVVNHLPLVKSLAKKMPVSSVMRDELVTFGLGVLSDLVREWNPKGATFGAFAKKWLRGAMRDHCKYRVRTVGGLTPDAIEAITHKTGRKQPKRSRDGDKPQWSAADIRVDEYLRGCGDSYRPADPNRKRGVVTGVKVPPIRLADLGPDFTQTLNDRQQMVYQRCILRDTPIAIVAGWLEIQDASQISRIKGQVMRKIEKCQMGLVFKGGRKGRAAVGPKGAAR